MATVWTEGLARLYGIVIDDLEKSIRECPDELWEANLWTVRRDDPFAAGPVRRAGSNEEGEHLLQVYSSFWFVAIHTLFFVDLDLGNAQPDFAPPEPFRTEDQEVNVIPRRTYTRDEVLGWVAHVRAKARVTLSALTEEEAERPAGCGGRPFADLLIRCLGHTREHTAQLSMFLGQHRAP